MNTKTRKAILYKNHWGPIHKNSLGWSFRIEGQDREVHIVTSEQNVLPHIPPQAIIILEHVKKSTWRLADERT